MGLADHLFLGHVGTNPGPVTPAQRLTPADFKSRSGLWVINISVRSLFSQMFKIRINSKPDIVLSEMELTESVQNLDICINGYNVYCTDIKEKTAEWLSLSNVFNVELVLSESVSTEYRMLLSLHVK